LLALRPFSRPKNLKDRCMSRFAITHIDQNHVRRRMVIGAPNNAMARDCAVRIYGAAWFMSCVRV